MAKDHFISKFYIKKFGLLNKKDSNSMNIYLLDLINWDIKTQSSWWIFYRKNLFNKETEKGFSKFESELSRLINSIENNITKIDNRKSSIKHKINDYLLLSKLFDFQIRRSMSVFSEKKVENNRDFLMKSLKECDFTDDFSIVELGKILEKNLQSNFVNFYAKKFFDSQNNLIEAISKRWFTILYLWKKSKKKFISWDFPINAVNSNWINGISNPDTELIIPLTPKILLISHWIDKKIKYVKLNNWNKIKYINKIIASSCYEYIFSDNPKLLQKIYKCIKKDDSIKWYLKNIDFTKWNIKLASEIKAFLKEKWKIIEKIK